jgi:murein DD-endopeptidase MepM/ murein hydrolase activator NlpD
LLDVSGPVSILVFRESDGALHPDATVSPPTGQLTNGHLRLSVTVQSIASLDGYTLGLGPSTGDLAGFLEGLFFPVSSGLNQFLKTAFNLGPAPLSAPTAQALLQTLEQRRTDNADAGPSWSYPIAGSGHPVSGTIGEWRGKNNNNVHRGVDLAAVAASTVFASRGGVVSHRGTLPGMGDYLVVDHGGGWFSRYLHLDSAYISVIVGQAVARGATLATRLYAVGNWPRHLHFEVRHAANQSQWNVAQPGIGQDPLQTPSIFAVPPGGALPELREFGLTRQHLGQNPFVKGPPTADAPGPVYLFVKFLDLEGGSRLGLRAMRFQPECTAVPFEIRPTNDTAIAAFLSPAVGAEKGFARHPKVTGSATGGSGTLPVTPTTARARAPTSRLAKTTILSPLNSASPSGRRLRMTPSLPCRPTSISSL